MSENLLTASLETEDTTAGRPLHVPEKFWDAATQSVRTEALLKSYQELERRLSSGSNQPVDRPQMLKALGVPDAPDQYEVCCDHGLFTPDNDINARMHQLGFTPEQAQFVYDLAAERMVPLLQQMAAEFQAEREIERLSQHFGGEDAWRQTAKQIFAWARRNLPPAAVEGLSTTYDGVMAMHRMMTGTEPAALGRPEADSSGDDPQRLMRDPRYWRDRDPTFIARVTEGFKRVYGVEN